MAGKRMGARAATVAGPEPDMAAKKQHTITVTIASPPNIWPTMTLANSTSRLDIPAFSMMTPVRMKNGIASRLNLAVPLYMVLANVVRLNPSFIKENIDEIPRQ